MKKGLGVMGIIVGSGFLLASFPSVFAAGELLTNLMFVLAIPILVWFLTYNWLIGPQKGHVAHLVNIIMYLAFSVIFFFRHQFPIAVFAGAVAAYLGCLLILVLNVRGHFRRDAQKGIVRDHFAGTRSKARQTVRDDV